MIDKSKFFERLALSVASGKTIRDAATDALCSESQAYRICHSVEFQQRVYAIRGEITCQAVGLLSNGAILAVSVLTDLLSSEEPKDRLAAAKAILANLAPLSEFGELRSRINDLEKRQLRLVG